MMKSVILIVGFLIVWNFVFGCSRSSSRTSHGMTYTELKQVERDAIEENIRETRLKREIRQSVMDHYTR